MGEKEYRIEFLQGHIKSDDNHRRVSHIFREIAAMQAAPQKIGTDEYALRVEAINNGRSYKGVFAKYRSDGLPHVGAPHGEERALDLDEDEGIIEKNHFLFYAGRNVLVYQTNRYGSSPSTVARYLSIVTDERIEFHPVLQQNALNRLLAGEGRPKSIEISYARPSDQAIARIRDDFSQELIDLLTTSGGARAHIRITPPRKRYLDLDVRAMMGRILDDLDVSVARVTLEQDGIEHAVDLIADRLFGHQTVRMDGRYPVTEEMYHALRACYEEHRQSIQDNVRDLGDGNN